MPANNNHLEKKLWEAADKLHADAGLAASEYSTPVLGLIFLRFADNKFSLIERELQAKAASTRRVIGKIDYQARGAIYLPPEARWSRLVKLPEGANIGKAINDAMRLIESENDDLKGVLPKTYNRLEDRLLLDLLRIFNAIPIDIEGDAFGKIYEYFLGNFAMVEGRRGGQFFTPTAIVKLIVEIIEPFKGMIYDPACGSGGMFVQSADFVKRHHVGAKHGTTQTQRAEDANASPSLNEISIYGQEGNGTTANLCKMNLAVHGLAGDIRQANSYYENLHKAAGQFDFVMANPPFNVSGVDKELLKDDTRRFPFGMPRNDNANYLWIQLFYSALNKTGRAGFVMANSASDARQSELDIRKQIIQSGAVDVMVAISNNFFYTVTLPCTLWFFDKGKKGTEREDKVLFIDARGIYRQLDRAHRDFTPNQIGFLASLVRLYRGEDLNGYQYDPEDLNLNEAQLEALRMAFKNRRYADVAGLCKVVDRDHIEVQDWSLNPGRYVGVAENGIDEIDFMERLEDLHDELEVLNAEAHKLEEQISINFQKIFEAG